ncbi:hypothetical protein [Emticicia sp. 17c]|uniref:hypothetical protein n=1 Tax=Emticicia sp. 17c TaxID=3127704 RepID=UPI00301D566B
MKKNTQPQGEKILIPVGDTPETARKIASELIPHWVNEVGFVLPQVQASSLSAICKKLYAFCRKNLAYAYDPSGKELIRSPYQSWTDRKKGIDCEDYAILIAACLIRLGYNPVLRIVDYGQGWQHIYVKVSGYVIDPVSEVYNSEEAFVKKMDFTVMPTGMSGSGNANDAFVKLMEAKLAAREKLNKRAVEKLASTYDISDPREVKELTELAIVNLARGIAHQPHQTVLQKYQQLVAFYGSQVNLSLRTSTSVLLQQYSTPSPIAYLMGVYCGVDKPTPGAVYLEPSAGNGLLTIAGDPSRFFVNELDYLRLENLRQQGFKGISQSDASGGSFPNTYAIRFDAVLTNPPFAALDKKDWQEFNGYLIKDLDHLMAIRALGLLKDEGRAAIIIGGHTDWDELGRIKSGKNRIFLNYLYHHYHIDDVILISGDLYARMGTSFNIRLLLVRSRKAQPEGFAPLRSDAQAAVIQSFEALYTRVMRSCQGANNQISHTIKARARRIRILTLKYIYESNP